MNSPEASDKRTLAYGHLHANQLHDELKWNEYSSRRILELVFGYYRPNSLLDVGCGLGTWLKMATTLGVTDVMGVDGEWIDPAKLEVTANWIQKHDLEKPFDLTRRFDLVVCLEVAEHLSKDAADTFIETLTRHAPAVLFSAAIPFQGGHHHVNEQYPPYWAAKFAARGFRPLDIIRWQIWSDDGVVWWLRQNAVLYVHDDLIAKNEKLRANLTRPAPLSLVHPVLYQKRMTDIRKMCQAFEGAKYFSVEADPHQESYYSISNISPQVENMTKVLDLVRTGGLFQVVNNNEGGFTVNRLSHDPDITKFTPAAPQTS